MTTSTWQSSSIITKYYILVTNALVSLAEKMRRNETMFGYSHYSKLHKFHFISNFCSNLVTTSVNTEKDDVFNRRNESYELMRSDRREEDALADLFCYEAMRTFGDRIMRPSTRNDFMTKLSDICIREFLCNKQYSPAYIDQLVLGNYHIREARAMIKLTNMTNPRLKNHAVRLIQEKCKMFTGNQLLHFIVDIPSGLNDLFKVSKMFFKEGKSSVLIGNSGSGKAELM
jgi:hypothetical protein